MSQASCTTVIGMGITEPTDYLKDNQEVLPMEKALNAYLADLVVESHKLQGLHWYVKGQGFFWAHAQFEKLYDSIALLIDEIAEAMLMSEMRPIVTLKDISAAATIKEAKASFVTAEDALAEIVGDFEQLLASVTSLRERADKDGNSILAVRADAQIEVLAKARWMLRQSLS